MSTKEMEKTKKCLAVLAAKEIWETKMSQEQKNVVRFGMLPMEIVLEYKANGIDGQELAAALMTYAQSNGGMVV